MVYTVTFNPAVDYIVRADRIKEGEVNRLSGEEIYFGGKGINVSLVLKELGVASKALGFVAGFTGEAIERGVREKGVETDFVRLAEGFSRINIKIKSDTETELNGCGPAIPEEAVKSLFDRLDGIRDGDTLVLAGSIPGSLPADMYERVLARLAGRNVRIAADASGELLMKVLKYRPFLVKPNNFELEEMFGVRLDTEEKIAEYAGKLKGLGAVNVLVSMAGDGALLIDEYGALHRCGVCPGQVKNSVGAGDSMVAGFIAGCEKNDYEYALKLGTAAGGATAFSEGLAVREEIYRLLEYL